MVPLVRDNNPLGTQKTVSLDVEEEYRLERGAGKLQNFQTDHFKLTVAAVIWLEYRRYGVKHYQINQSKIKRSERVVADIF